MMFSLGLAIGNSLIRPVFPSYLGSIAPKDRSAEYIAISSTFGNLGMMAAGNLTRLYSISRRDAIYFTGLLSIVNALVILIYLIYEYFTFKKMIQMRHHSTSFSGHSKSFRLHHEHSTLKGSTPEELAKRNNIEQFFGYGEQMDEATFWADVQSSLSEIIKAHGYSKAMNTKKGQVLIKTMLLQALPQLPNNFDEKMEAYYQLYLQLGYEEWANDLAGKEKHDHFDIRSIFIWYFIYLEQ